MTKKERAALYEYVAAVADRLTTVNGLIRGVYYPDLSIPEKTARLNRADDRLRELGMVAPVSVEASAA